MTVVSIRGESLGLEPLLLFHQVLELEASPLLRLGTDGPTLELSLVIRLEDGAEPPAVGLPLVEGALSVHSSSGHRCSSSSVRIRLRCLHDCLHFSAGRDEPQTRIALTWRNDFVEVMGLCSEPLGPSDQWLCGE